MVCPVCGGATRVDESRPSEDQIIRYRKCHLCNYRFRTIEIDEDLMKKLTEARRNTYD